MEKQELIMEVICFMVSMWVLHDMATGGLVAP